MSAQCPAHPELPALGACARCGTFVCVRCATTLGDGQLSCQACAARIPAVELASRRSRFWAHLVDTFIVTSPVLLAFVIVELRRSFANLYSGSEDVLKLGGLAALLMCVVQTIAARHGQSLGKRLFRIRVVRDDGSPASLLRIVVLRNVLPIGFCGALPLGLFLMPIDGLTIFGPQRRCLHDVVAGTKVLTVPRQRTPHP